MSILPRQKSSSTFGCWRASLSIGRVIRRRTIRGCEKIKLHDLRSSLPLGVKRFAHADRGHRGIEYRPHWPLDVDLAQDASRIRKAASPEIASLLRHLALMTLPTGHPVVGKPLLPTQARRMEQQPRRIAPLPRKSQRLCIGVRPEAREFDLFISGSIPRGSCAALC